MQAHQPLPLHNRTSRQPLPLPDLSPELWCDFRRDYEADNGVTMKDLAKKYHCDPRTVRKCLLTNRNSEELGKQTAPTKLAPFINQINTLFEEYQQTTRSVNSGIYTISREITDIIRQSGYTGSERTVRNHLRVTYYQISEKSKEG